MTYILNYNHVTKNIAQYKFNVSDIIIEGFAYFNNSDRLVLHGTYNHLYAYTGASMLDTIYDYPNMTKGNLSMIENLGSNYEFASHTITFSNTVETGSVSGSSPSTLNINLVQIYEEYVDVVYSFKDTTHSDLLTLMENDSENVTISITCSINGTVTLQHTLVDYNATYIAPNWVEVDGENNQLVMNMPEVTQNTTYKFKIQTNHYGSTNYYYKTVTLQVILHTFK